MTICFSRYTIISNQKLVKLDIFSSVLCSFKLEVLPEVLPDDTILTLQDVVTRMVQQRRADINVDPVPTSASTSPSWMHTAPASILLEPQSESAPQTRLPL
jgi:hypothetical protein